MKKWVRNVGKKFGSLTLVGVEKVNKKYPGIYVCDCGNRVLRDMGSVNLGKYKSCGCLENYNRKLSATKHGHSRVNGSSESPEYNSWRAMKQRCLNPKSKAYPDYGGRGIKICKQWKESFNKFLEDMGNKPSPQHTIERINNDWGYTPSNCRWATRIEQSRNKRPRKSHTV